MIAILIKASIIIIVLLAFYKLFLEKESFYNANRIYLLSCLLFACTLPFVFLPKLVKHQGIVIDLFAFEETSVIKEYNEVDVNPIKVDQPDHTKPSLAKTKNQQSVDVLKKTDQLASANIQRTAAKKPYPNPSIEKQTPKNYLYYFKLIYLFGVVVFLVNFLAQLLLTSWKIFAHDDRIKDEEFYILNMKGEQDPCSFFNYIFINPNLYDFSTYEQIITHEKLHHRHKHCIDLLLAEIAIVVLWFNPFVWLLRKEVEKNIEYQTDDYLINSHAEIKEDYQLNLVKIATYTKPLNITTNYNQSLLKQRILRMNAKKSNQFSYLKYAFVAPLLMTLVLTLNKPVDSMAIEERPSFSRTLNQAQQENESEIQILEASEVLREEVVVVEEVEKVVAVVPIENQKLENNPKNKRTEPVSLITIGEVSACQQLYEAAVENDLQRVSRLLANFDPSCLPNGDEGDYKNIAFLKELLAANGTVKINRVKETITVTDETGRIKVIITFNELIGKEGDTYSFDYPINSKINVTISETTHDSQFEYEAENDLNERKHPHKFLTNEYTGDKDCKKLTEAILANDLSAIKSLLEKVDPNCFIENPGYFEKEFVGSAYVNRKPSTPLFAAARTGNIEVAKLLINAGAKVDYLSRSEGNALMYAVAHGQKEMMEFLMAEGIDPKQSTTNQGNALIIAAFNGYEKICKHLVEEAGMDVNFHSMNQGTALIAASSNGHLELVKYLSKQGADINYLAPNQGTAITSAASNGHTDVIKYLHSKGGDLKFNAPNQGCALLGASNNGHLETVKYLLEQGVSVNFISPNQGTALLVACNNGFEETAKYLIEKGAKIDLIAPNQGTALMAACNNAHLDLIKFLVSKGAEVNLISPNQGTAMMFACNNGHLEVLKYLIENGADTEIEVNGQTAKRAAQKNGHRHLFPYLK